MSKIELGNIVKLIVEDVTARYYVLSNGKNEVTLPLDEADLQIGSMCEVFIYTDRSGKLQATTKIPNVQLDQFGWAKVVDVKRNLGVFVDIGIPKEILVSKDELPIIENLWPEVDDQLFVKLDFDRRGRMLATLAKESDIQNIASFAEQNLLNQQITGTVYSTKKVGTFLITKEFYRCFIHESERETEPRLGEEVTGRVIAVKEDGSLNVSLLPRKHERIDQDADVILNFLMNRPARSMPYSDKSSPEDIELQFGMSKGAFKRALGKLLKEKKIYQQDGWTFILNNCMGECSK